MLRCIARSWPLLALFVLFLPGCVPDSEYTVDPLVITQAFAEGEAQATYAVATAVAEVATALAQTPAAVEVLEVTRIVEVPLPFAVTRIVTESERSGQSAGATATPRPRPTQMPAPTRDSTAALADEPVTFFGALTADVNLDPQLVDTSDSETFVANLFLNLTDINPATGEVLAEAATDWAVSDDGLAYTFQLRSDIPWVRYDAREGMVRQAVENGQPRFVTAADFEFAIKRACDPDFASYYASIAAPVIKGCADLLYASTGSVPQSLIDAVGVTAINDHELMVELEYPAAYLPSLLSMWPFAATPDWVIDAHGAAWTEPGNIVVSGHYVPAAARSGMSSEFRRNSLLPADLAGRGNVARLQFTVVEDEAAGYDLWLNNKIDRAAIPDENFTAHSLNYADEMEMTSDQAVFYLGFRTTKAPFDDPHVRRAFSAAIDRDALIAAARRGAGVPMTHLAPPGIFGAPPIDEVGVGYNPTFAAAELAAAGYPDCERMPEIHFIGYSGQSTLDWLNFVLDSWQEVLGCAASTFNVEQLAFAELIAMTNSATPDSDAPHIWTLGWGPDYPDENNWVSDVLGCNSYYNRSRRACSELDDLMVAAQQETDPAARAALYREIEEGLFGPEGEQPIAPLFLRVTYVARHAWFDFPPAGYAGDLWYTWRIDQADQRAAR